MINDEDIKYTHDWDALLVECSQEYENRIFNEHAALINEQAGYMMVEPQQVKLMKESALACFEKTFKPYNKLIGT